MAIKEIALAAINNPKLLIGAGIGLFVGAAVWGCVQTLKVEDIVDEANEKIDDIVENHSEEELELPEVKKEIGVVRAKMVGKIVLNYTGPVVMAGMAAYAICRAYGLQRQAYLAMSAAYGTMAKAYDAVLDRVEKKWGQDGLKYAKYGIEQEEVEKEIVDEKGKKKKIKEKEDICTERWEDVRKSSPFAIVFDEETSLYKSCGGSLIKMRSELVTLESWLQTKYNQGVPLFYNSDVVRNVAGDDTRWLSDLGQVTGWYSKDLKNVEATDGTLLLNYYTFNGTDPETGERKQYIAIDPNCELIDLDANKTLYPTGILQLDTKKRVGGRYISQVRETAEI
jgi:hypothetical protein